MVNRVAPGQAPFRRRGYIRPAEPFRIEVRMRPSPALALVLALPLLVGAAAPVSAQDPAPAPAAGADPTEVVLPGRWEYKYRILGIPAATEHWCLKPQEIQRAFDGPCNRHHTCTYPVKEVADGKLKLQGRWVDKRGRAAPVSGSGDYGPNTINLNFRGRTIHGLPFAGSMRARRISNTCQPGDK